jgi:hypothetical protein
MEAIRTTVKQVETVTIGNPERRVDGFADELRRVRTRAGISMESG